MAPSVTKADIKCPHCGYHIMKRSFDERRAVEAVRERFRAHLAEQHPDELGNLAEVMELKPRTPAPSSRPPRGQIRAERARAG
jgi:hypothetical protein